MPRFRATVPARPSEMWQRKRGSSSSSPAACRATQAPVRPCSPLRLSSQCSHTCCFFGKAASCTGLGSVQQCPRPCSLPASKQTPQAGTCASAELHHTQAAAVRAETLPLARCHQPSHQHKSMPGCVRGGAGGAGSGEGEGTRDSRRSVTREEICVSRSACCGGGSSLPSSAQKTASRRSSGKACGPRSAASRAASTCPAQLQSASLCVPAGSEPAAVSQPGAVWRGRRLHLECCAAAGSMASSSSAAQQRRPMHLQTQLVPPRAGWEGACLSCERCPRRLALFALRSKRRLSSDGLLRAHTCAASSRNLAWKGRSRSSCSALGLPARLPRSQAQACGGGSRGGASRAQAGRALHSLPSSQGELQAGTC